MTVTTESNSTLRPIIYRTPAVNPSPNGLYAATAWTETADGEPSRFLTGVRVLPQNFDGTGASGVWGADWCAQPDDLAPDDMKAGARWPGLAAFDALTVWAYDECDLTELSMAETRARATNTLRLNEQLLTEREFAGRLLLDAGAPATATAIVDAVAELEAKMAAVGQVGVIHASAGLAAKAAAAMLLSRTGSGYISPLGHRWTFGGGYVAGLGNTLVATAPLVGWRDQPAVRETLKPEHNRHAVIAERSLVVGYEHSFGAVTIT